MASKTVAMSSRRRGAGDDEVLRVDLEGFPTTWPVRQGRFARCLWIGLVVLGLVQLVRQVTGDMDVFLLVLTSAQVLLGTLMLVVLRTTGVRLEAAGYRVGDVLYKGRLWSWAQVREIRPGSTRWGTQVEIRGRTASSRPVALHGMSDEQATDLWQRLAAARAGADSALAQEQEQ
ncbi:hypothetical protein [Jannaschia sp. R86511]|uniref:hypothetical protein n=1 Tax=Jannaschia sp. R86511 TaxID=3093853 RepID=UPI0036D25D65